MKIDQNRNWCEIDQLGGMPIRDGEWLEIHWPDGSVTSERVKLRITKRTVSDMGHNCDIPVRQAGVTVNYHGVPVWVRIPLDVDVWRTVEPNPDVKEGK